MLEELARRDAPARIQAQRGHEQVDAERADGAEGLQVEVAAAHRLLHVGAHVARQARHPRPVVLGRGADGAADEVELVHVGAPRDEGGAQHQLGQHQAHGPHVDGAGVVLGAVQQLRRPVPARDDVGRHAAVGVGEAAGQAEVGQLERAVGRHQQVVGLDVAVQHEVGVAEPHAAAQHARPGLDVGQPVRHARRVLDQHLQVAERQVLEHQVQVLPLRREDGVQRDDVGVRQLLQELDLADRVEREAVLVVGQHLDLLDGHLGAGVVLEVAEVHDGVGALADLAVCRRLDTTPLLEAEISTFDIAVLDFGVELFGKLGTSV